MNLSDWARNEIKIANSGIDSEESGYVKGCMNSAVKAFLGLCGDGHSGMSIGITKNILDRLVDCKPLTSLTGSEDEWDEVYDVDSRDGFTGQQNKRCSSVFRYKHNDGRVEYSDIDRFVCEDINNGNRYHNGHAKRIAEEIFPPITMPYYPQTKPTVLFMEDFLLDRANGDFDHKAVFYAITPSGEKVNIDRYFKEVDGVFVDISREEYLGNRMFRLNTTEYKDIQHSDLSKVQDDIFNLDNKKDVGKISDGSHTFDELYYHRMMLFSIICNTYKDVAWKSWLHDDGTMYDDYFIVGVSLPNGDFTYHYHKDFWDKFDVKILDKAPKYDGHTADDITRLETLV